MHSTSCLFFLSKTKQKQNRKPKANKIKFTKIIQPETKPKEHRIYLYLANYWWACILPWSLLDLPSDIPFGKTDFPIPRSYQFKITLCLGVWTFYLLSLFSFGNLSGLKLCRSSACCHSPYEFIGTIQDSSVSHR